MNDIQNPSTSPHLQLDYLLHNTLPCLDINNSSSFFIFFYPYYQPMNLTQPTPTQLPYFTFLPKIHINNLILSLTLPLLPIHLRPMTSTYLIYCESLHIHYNLVIYISFIVAPLFACSHLTTYVIYTDNYINYTNLFC